MYICAILLLGEQNSWTSLKNAKPSIAKVKAVNQIIVFFQQLHKEKTIVKFA